MSKAGNQELLTLSQIMQRVQLARFDALGLFINAKSGTDFYFEELLNTFIALAQTPLNFAILANSNGRGELVHHFCWDKEHERDFLKIVQDTLRQNPNIGDADAAFPIFPSVLGSSLFLLILKMHTKVDSRITPLLRPGPGTLDTGDAKGGPDAIQITQFDRYLAVCANHFFSTHWDDFDGPFGERVRSYVSASIEVLSRSPNTWTERQRLLRTELARVGAPRQSRDAWKDELIEVFSPALDNSYSRIAITSEMMKAEPNGGADERIPNMLLAFRAFSRDPATQHNDARRHATERGAYLYDSSFLAPPNIASSFKGYLKRLRNEYIEHMESSVGKTENSISSHFFSLGRRLFRDIQLEHGSPGNLALLASADDDFWRSLTSGPGDEGVNNCLATVGSWVGSQSRSLVDPVYQTGLIHTNLLFEHGGLDRLGSEVTDSAQSIADLSVESAEDLRRIVLLYYLLAEMVEWRGAEEPDFSRKLAAVLVPIKMRGSVWGVSVHGAWIPDTNSVFVNERYWRAYFKITTDLRRKNTSEFDKCLWTQALARVERVIEDMVGEVHSPHELPDRISVANDLILREMRVSPFAFPKILTKKQLVDDIPNDRKVVISPRPDEPFTIAWDIIDNPFFTAHQEWNREGTRNFCRVVDLGMRRGLEAMRQAIEHRRILDALSNEDDKKTLN